MNSAYPFSSDMFIYTVIGAWRSLVAHLLWEQGVGGSNPLAPTIIIGTHNRTPGDRSAFHGFKPPAAPGIQPIRSQLPLRQRGEP